MDEKLLRDKGIISYRDAVPFNTKVMARWKPQSEVWPFTYGNDIAGIFSSGSGLYITYSFRKFLKLRGYGTQTCYLPVVGLAAIGSYVLHTYYATTKLLRNDYCSLCLATRIGIGQTICSTAYPLFMSSLVCFYLSDRLLTYPVPSLTRAPGEVFQLWLKIVQKHRTPLAIISAVNFAVAMFITVEKYKVLIKISQ